MNEAESQHSRHCRSGRPTCSGLLEVNRVSMRTYCLSRTCHQRHHKAKSVPALRVAEAKPHCSRLTWSHPKYIPLVSHHPHLRISAHETRFDCPFMPENLFLNP